MSNCVILSNPFYVAILLCAAFLWLWSHGKKNKIIPIVSCLAVILVMTAGALGGAGYNELILISLAFALSGIIRYDGGREDGK